jgi:hypothetical protein
LQGNKTENDLESVEDKWIYFLKNARNLDIIPEQIVENEIREAFNLLNKSGWTNEELEVNDTISIYRQDERC